jgi:glycosyltransferase involved in cell wall biosynthesis
MTSVDDPVEDVAIAHWGEHINGGGDRVAWELARVFEDAPLYVGWKDESIEPDDIETEQVIEGRLIEWALESGGALRMFAHLLGWQKADPLRDHDVIVTSGNEPLFYVAPTEQAWVSYIHHTNRRQSDQINEVSDGKFTPIKLLFFYLIRVAFDHNTNKPDVFLANSEQVKRRMIRYWGIPAEKIYIVYPPVGTHEYSRNDAETGDYYLTLSRLDWHKSVDDIVRAFEGFNAKLVVAGDGPEREKLERMAGENVEFAGYVGESEKKKLLAGAKAFIFNGQEEDFGISPVEALAAGTPLIGVKEGMTQYQIGDGKNGFKFARDESGESICEAVKHFEAEGVAWDDAAIEDFADKFSVDAFHERMHEAVDRAVEFADVTPEWYERVCADSP